MIEDGRRKREENDVKKRNSSFWTHRKNGSEGQNKIKDEDEKICGRMRKKISFYCDVVIVVWRTNGKNSICFFHR